MDSKTFKELTRAEEEVMQVLWELKQAFVKDMLPLFKESNPAYNTVSTIVRILEDKGFIAHKSYGKAHEYYPIVSKDEYSRYMIKDLTSGYFGGSFKSLVSFMIEDKDLSLSEIEEIKKLLKKKEK